jgi:predicted nucleic acid-binding protein
MIALDTNVLIYACDRSDPQRQQTAIQLVASSTDGVLLRQVAQLSPRTFSTDILHFPARVLVIQAARSC